LSELRLLVVAVKKKLLACTFAGVLASLKAVGIPNLALDAKCLFRCIDDNTPTDRYTAYDEPVAADRASCQILSLLAKQIELTAESASTADPFRAFPSDMIDSL
jgi:hypothetical protein